MRLLASYKAALAAFDSVASPAFQGLAPEHITFREARRARDDAHLSLYRARQAYWRHLEEHGCPRIRTTAIKYGESDFPKRREHANGRFQNSFYTLRN